MRAGVTAHVDVSAHSSRATRRRSFILQPVTLSPVPQLPATRTNRTAQDTSNAAV